MGKITTGFAVAAAVLGVLELLLGLGSMICAFIHSSKTHGQLYEKFYQSSPVNTRTEYAKPYWWGGVPAILPGICGLVVVFKRTPLSMGLFILSNVICFFVSLALAVVVGIFIGLWDILDSAYHSDVCKYIYDQTYNRIYCLCEIKDANKFDADRARVFVDSCSDISVITVVLTTIIAISCVSAVLCLATSVMSCVALGHQESPYKSNNKSSKQIQQQYLLQQQQAMSQARAAPQPTFQPAPAPAKAAPAASIAYKPPAYKPVAQTLGTNEPSMML